MSRSLRDRALPPRRPLPGEPGGCEWRHAEYRGGYLICTVQRTGSTRLCELLRNTGVAGWPAEYFVRWNGPDDYRGRFPGTDQEFFRWARWQASTENGACGIKVMGNQIELACRRLAPIVGLDDAPMREIIEAWLPGVRFIRLSRRNRVRQAISLYRQHATGVSHLRQGEGAPEAPIFSYQGIDGCLDFVKYSESVWDRFFGDKQPDLELEFDDVVEDGPAVVKKICGLVGVDSPVSETASAHQELADAITDRWEREFCRQRKVLKALGPSR